MYDANRYDAEILLERSGISTFTVEGLCRVLRCCRTTLYQAKKDGKVPEPEIAAPGKPSEWDREQVIEMLAHRLSAPKRKPKVAKPAVKPRPRLKTIPHGTYPGFDAHVRRGVPVCQPCRDAKNAYKREWRARKKVAA
jgi:hypothetical protein